jgi:hypothetical protein
MTSISGNTIKFGRFNHFQNVALQQVGQDPVGLVRYAQEVKPEYKGFLSRTVDPESEKAAATAVAAAVVSQVPLSKQQVNEIGRLLEKDPSPVSPELFQAYLSANAKQTYPVFPPIEKDSSHIFGPDRKAD